MDATRIQAIAEWERTKLEEQTCLNHEHHFHQQRSVLGEVQVVGKNAGEAVSDGVEVEAATLLGAARDVTCDRPRIPTKAAVPLAAGASWNRLADRAGFLESEVLERSL